MSWQGRAITRDASSAGKRTGALGRGADAKIVPILTAAKPALGALKPYTIPVVPLSGVYSVRLQPVEPSGEEFGNRRGMLKALKENLHHGGERNG